MRALDGTADRDKELIEDLDTYLPQPIGVVRYKGTDHDLWHWKDLPPLKGFEFVDLWDSRAAGIGKGMLAPLRRKHELRMIRIICPTLPVEADQERALTDHKLSSLLLLAMREPTSPPANGGGSADGSASPSPSDSTVAGTPETATAT